MDVVLGFDTSCYTTSAAAVDISGHVVGSQRMLLPVQIGQRGLRQSEAVFVHIRQTPKVMEGLESCLQAANAQICAVAASTSPSEDEGSYMPVFTVGLSHANVLSKAFRVPCYLFSHQQGHIAAGQIGSDFVDEPFVALHLSGGTTDLLSSEAGRLLKLGGSLDLHAGQLVDRVGVAMGLPFPAGPSLEKLAMSYPKPAQSILPGSMERGDLHCHLSGAETKCMQMLAKQEMPNESLALEVFDFISRTVTRLLIAGCAKARTRRALVVGGVASSLLLRELVFARLRKVGSDIQVIFGKPEYSADNAAGIALLGMRKHLEVKKTQTMGGCV